ncbi:MAG TPA: iron-sulfur cluster assembly scaffold protein [Xanthomonadaceae bacterium]|nr:iron-sulfur cluster assembly scaffold protein [Xanthomonadaceae bacterium]
MSRAEHIASLYRDLLRDCAASPDAHGLIDEPTHAAEGDNPLCGDHLRVELRLDGTRIADIGFAGDCCVVARASAALMCRLLRNGECARHGELAQALRQVLRGGEAGAAGDVLGPLHSLREVPERHKCALLPWAAAEAALLGEHEATTEPISD